ncbi:Dual specificity protein phosphatase 14 [Penaeus vannamei]|uniref:Dual specificity protein phosphatase 14 n=1 Tax=Penaeus vannamei TaxID=6689 RepID=A0A3R7MKK8_PENVA|nr:dual specificity protein phosphatase 14-like [Penaeus vannamei]ROT84218.1 Dual specificity protein phosphatase 14 [Penaeus vannamei]
MPEQIHNQVVVRIADDLEDKPIRVVSPSCRGKDQKKEPEQRKPRTGRAGEVSVILDWLCLSGARAVRQARLREFGITCVINCTVELPAVPLDGVEVASPNLSSYMSDIADKIEEERRRGGRVLVHCVAGVSRSPALVLAYLVKHCDMSLREAFLHARKARPNIRPNAGFFAQLIEFEREVRGGASVTLVRDAALGLAIPDVCEDELRALRDTREPCAAGTVGRG